MADRATDQPAPRRRRRRRARRDGEERHAAAEAKPVEDTQPIAEWEWRTFPVFFAFSIGMLVMGFAVPSPLLTVVLFVVALACVAFGVIHIFTQAVRKQRRGRR